MFEAYPLHAHHFNRESDPFLRRMQCFFSPLQYWLLCIFKMFSFLLIKSPLPFSKSASNGNSEHMGKNLQKHFSHVKKKQMQRIVSPSNMLKRLPKLCSLREFSFHIRPRMFLKCDMWPLLLLTYPGWLFKHSFILIVSFVL